MFNKRYWICTAVQLMLATNPSYDNRTIASTLKMQIWIATNNRDVPRVYLDVLKSVVIPWYNQGPVADPGCGSRNQNQTTSPKRPRLGFRRSAMTLYPSLTGCPPPEPAGLLLLVICQEHHQHDLPQHQSQPDRRHPPSIH